MLDSCTLTSPRLSFSGDPQPDLPPTTTTTTTTDFNFLITPSAHSPSTADRLFSGGFLLPLPLPPPPKPSLKHLLQENNPNPQQPTTPKPSFWRFGRSSSVGAPRSRLVGLLTRSKSTGCSLLASNHPSPVKQQRGSCSRNKSYYYGHGGGDGGGVRISPVLNVPCMSTKERGDFFGFGLLLCNGKERTSHKKKKPLWVSS